MTFQSKFSDKKYAHLSTEMCVHTQLDRPVRTRPPPVREDSAMVPENTAQKSDKIMFSPVFAAVTQNVPAR
jgi:hypothetical protein